MVRPIWLAVALLSVSVIAGAQTPIDHIEPPLCEAHEGTHTFPTGMENRGDSVWYFLATGVNGPQSYEGIWTPIYCVNT
jgi:hypothetical protein